MTNLVNVSQQQNGVMLLELNRPEARNALNVALLTELTHTIQAISQQPGQRVLILHGAGPVFCAGLDLKEAADPNRAHLLAHAVAEALKALYFSPLVTIGTAQGAAIAGGAGILSACDLVVAAEGTHIGYPETRRGLVAALVMTILRRQVGDRHLRELLLTGELISAERALAIGLINHVVASHLLLEKATDLANSILKGAPIATTLTKSLLEELAPVHLENDIDRALAYHLQARATNEADEGIRAFAEKRDPHW